MRVSGCVLDVSADATALDDAAGVFGVIAGCDDAGMDDFALLEPTGDLHNESRALDALNVRGMEFVRDTQDGAIRHRARLNGRVVPQQFLMRLPDHASVDRSKYARIYTQEKTLERINELLESRNRCGGE